MQSGEIKLTEKQSSCVRFKPEGSLLVRGIPGSGKSTIILARAEYLLEKHPDESVVILTYNRTLCNYVKQLSKKNGQNMLDAITFHYWGQTLLKETDYPHTRLILGKQRNEVVRFAKNIVKKNNDLLEFPNMPGKHEQRELESFLADEIEWIKGNRISSRKEYLDVSRAGRGTKIRVTKKHRDSIYDVLEKYNELLWRYGKYQGVDGEDLANLLIEKVHMIPLDKRPDHILVDEAQDLHTVQLRAIKEIAKKSLTIGADKGQQIYRRTFTWKQAGIEVAGSRSRFLDETFRSTRQIIRLANQFQQSDELYIKDEEYSQAVEPDIEGSVPKVCFCDSKSDELKKIIRYIKNIRSSFKEDTIGVIARTKGQIEEFESAISAEGIPVFNIKEDDADIISPGVKLITYHSSKGLEFDHVIVTGLKEGDLPYKGAGPGEDEEEFISRERKKFYVGMTRAKKTLYITARRPYSSFIAELNENLYEVDNK
ncbi:ATP-dependent helicase [Jeotgalibacillus sp. R-1-5s-1]|nr:ATP-dependent helicase [Jeotgalibacillus sp. R-1-5s-1]